MEDLKSPLLSKPDQPQKMRVKSILLTLVLGQLLSLSLTYIGFTYSLLANKGFDAPHSQCFFNYLFLALVYMGKIHFRGEPIKSTWPRRQIPGVLEVTARLLVVEAYQYTSLTSIMLLDCWTIPCVLLLSMVFLRARFGFQKLVGVAICAAGLVALVFSDVYYADGSSGSNPLKGDLLVIVGAVLYGLSNVSEEFSVKNADRVEILAIWAFFGAFSCAMDIYFKEFNEFKSILSSPGTIFPLVGSSLAMLLFYTGVPLLLKISGSKMLNLSLLTSNLWPVLIRIFVYHEKVHGMYFVAFAAVTCGLFVYVGEAEMVPDDDEKADLGLDEKTRFSYGISNKDGSRISFQGTINSLFYILDN